MKIHGKETRIPAPELGAPAGHKAAERHGTQNSEKPAADGATFSPKAREAHRLRAKVKQVPEVREELVRRIKAQVESGSYKVDAGDVADKLLKSGVLE